MKPVAIKTLFAIISAITLASCGNDDNDNIYSLRMKDGNVIKIDKSSSLNLENEAQKSTMRSILPKVGEADSVFGYTSCDSASYWIKTKVGNWADKYNLSPKKEYVSRTEYYFKEIPMRSDEHIAYYLPQQAKMELNAENCLIDYKIHINPNVTYPLQIGFGQNAYNGNWKGTFLPYTAIIHVKYDSEGNVVNVYYPCKPQELTWYFTRFTLDELLNYTDH